MGYTVINGCLEDSEQPPMAARWEALEANHPSCARLLLEMARDVYDGNAGGWRIPCGADPEDLGPAITMGLVRVAERQVFFTSPERERHVLAQYVVREHLLPLWEDEEAFVEALRKAALYERVPRPPRLSAYALVLLHNTYKKDIVARVADQTKEGREFPRLYADFTDALPDLKVDASRLIPK